MLNCLSPVRTYNAMKDEISVCRDELGSHDCPSLDTITLLMASQSPSCCTWMAYVEVMHTKTNHDTLPNFVN